MLRFSNLTGKHSSLIALELRNRAKGQEICIVLVASPGIVYSRFSSSPALCHVGNHHPIITLEIHSRLQRLDVTLGVRPSVSVHIVNTWPGDRSVHRFYLRTAGRATIFGLASLAIFVTSGS